MKECYVKQHGKDASDSKFCKLLDVLLSPGVEDEPNILADNKRDKDDDNNIGVGEESEVSTVNVPVVENM